MADNSNLIMGLLQRGFNPSQGGNPYDEDSMRLKISDNTHGVDNRTQNALRVAALLGTPNTPNAWEGSTSHPYYNWEVGVPYNEPTGMAYTRPDLNGDHSRSGNATFMPGRFRSAGVVDPNQMGVELDPRMHRAGNEIINYHPVGDNRVGQPPYSSTLQGIQYINSIPGEFDASYPVPIPGQK